MLEFQFTRETKGGQQTWMIPSPCSEGTTSGRHLDFSCALEAGEPSLARMRECDVVLRSNVVSNFRTEFFARLQFSYNLFMKMYRFDWNERENTITHECKRQLRQKQRRGKISKTWLWYKRATSEDCNSADIVGKVGGLEKQATSSSETTWAKTSLRLETPE